MNRLVFIILLVFGIFLQHFSQSKFDSVLSMLQVDSIHDTTKIRNLYYAADDISLESPDSANKLLDIGLDYLETSNQIFEADSNNRFTKDIFKREYYNLKGITCFILKRERECLDYWMKAEKIASRVNDTNSLLSIKNNIAIVYSSSGRNKEALDIFKAQFSGAMNPLIHITKDKLNIFKGDPQPIGYLSGKETLFSSHCLKLKKGDMIYLFSDGFQDQFGGEKGKKYCSLKFRNFLHSISDKSTDDQEELIDEEFINWLGDYEQIDDVCIMGVRIT